ncbi:MAG: hypothetical protein IKQ61_09450 [Spirochaetales bacterium]|nr:hypothetical protein [Spirochaetales bacterium]
MFNFIFTKKMRMFVIGLLMNVIFVGVISAQTRIAVLPFTPDEKISKAAMSYLTEIFTFEMVNSRKFTVVERAKLDAALKEMQLQSGDLFDEGSAVELGKMAGAEMVFFGSIFRFGGRELLSIKGMDIKTATLKYAKQEKGGNDKKLEAAVKLIAKQIIDETVGTEIVSQDNEKISSVSTDSYSRNIVVNGKAISLSIPEAKLYHKDITDRWGISPDNQEEMWHYYKLNKNGGTACAVVGGVSLGIGVILIAALTPVGLQSLLGNTGPFYAGLGVGIPLIVAGFIVTPMCAIGFSKASRIKSIYKKTTGQKLTAFLLNTSIGGGYDWDKKEVTVAMAIKL